MIKIESVDGGFIIYKEDKYLEDNKKIVTNRVDLLRYVLQLLPTDMISDNQSIRIEYE